VGTDNKEQVANKEIDSKVETGPIQHHPITISRHPTINLIRHSRTRVIIHQGEIIEVNNFSS
jgi:hypothetical protein